MSPSKRTLAGLALAALSALASLAVYSQLPDQMAIQFSVTGQPDGYLQKPLAVTLLPGVAVGVVGLFALVPYIDPLGENIESFQWSYDLLAVTTVGVLAYAQGLVLLFNLGYDFQMGQVLAPVLAVTSIVIGVVMERAEPNWFVGIRTPWTLSDADVWRQTHDRGAVLFKGAGLLAALAVPFPEYFIYLAVVPLVFAALAATVYSYVAYRRLHGS